MPRAIVLGIVGDSGAGKTTVTRGLTRVIGDAHVTHVSADDYHRYDRRRRRELGVTPLHPDSNHLDILTQHIGHLRRGEAVLKPVYSHQTGEFEPPAYVRPAKFLVVEGLLNFHTETLRSLHDVRVALSPPEELRRAWKLKRDCTRRGYTTDEVLAELDARQSDAEEFIQPQRTHADIVVAFAQRKAKDPAHLDADVILRDTLPHPDLSPLLDGSGPSLIKREREWLLHIPGNLDSGHAAELEEAVWERMSFASHLRIRRLGEFTVGTDLFRSDSLALVQLLILYHVVTARAALAIGGSSPRADPRFPTGADSALHA
jgi:phosphoribulokinase